MDDVLRIYIDKIWIKYDDDNNGYLDREETKQFISDSIKGVDMDTLRSTSKSADSDSEDSVMNDKQLDRCFQIFDEDNSGMITKSEMFYFIKMFTGME